MTARHSRAEIAPCRHLRAVDAEEAPLDITLAMRAEIMRRDWSACHVRGDRAQPLELSDRPKRTWAK